MFKATINENRISVTNPDNEIITSGSVNVNFIEFEFTNDWLGLHKTVIFQTRKVTLPVILEDDKLIYQMPIPWEVLLIAGESISVGAYGTRMDDAETLEDEEIVLPTVWGSIPEKVRQGVIVSDPIETSPTHNAYVALLDIINKILSGEIGGGIKEGNEQLVPAGGTAGQMLIKNTDRDYDTGWVTPQKLKALTVEVLESIMTSGEVKTPSSDYLDSIGVLYLWKQLSDALTDTEGRTTNIPIAVGRGKGIFDGTKLSIRNDSVTYTRMPVENEKFIFIGFDFEGFRVASDCTLDAVGESATTYKIDSSKLIDGAFASETDVRSVRFDVMDLSQGLSNLQDTVSSINDAVQLLPTEEVVDQKIVEATTSVYRFKGSVPSYDALPTENLNGGDVYNVVENDGMNYAWVAPEGDTAGYWDPLGPVFQIQTIPDSVINDIISGNYNKEDSNE